MPDAPTPDMLKRMKVDVPAPPVQTNLPVVNGSNKGKSRAVTIQDESEEGQEEDVEMSTDFAPGNDADYFAEEDEEGRFFGGGLTEEQKTILNIFDKAGGEGTLDDVSISLLRQTCLTVLRLDVDRMKA